MFCPPFHKKEIRPNVLNNAIMAELDNAELVAKFEALGNEYQICRWKLDSKNEALLILSKELDQCRSERDQFKLMAEQLRERYQSIKRQIVGTSVPASADNHLDPMFYMDMQNQSLVKLLCDTKEHNKSLQFEVDDLKQKLHDAQGDIKLLREQIARQRVGTTDEGINTRHFPAYEREDLVQQLEASREQYVQLERDLQQVLDEKEEQVTERDAYKTKYARLNQELNYILKGDEKRIVDIDALVMENKYLQERLKQMEEEKSMAMATVSKYKSMLERKKNKGILKLGQSRSGGLVITQKQVQQMLQAGNKTGMPATPQAMADLQNLCGALLDTINDKTLALSHQRKTNKILGNRVSELEKKLKTLEVAGLWNVPGNAPNLAKLQAECEEMKMLVPRHMSQSSDTSDKTHDIMDGLDSDISSSTPSPNTSPLHAPQKGVSFGPVSVGMEDLDLLPTKDGSGKRTESSSADEMKNVAFDLDSPEKGDCSTYNIKCNQVQEDATDTTDENPEDENAETENQEDLETAEKLKIFMEDVTAKIKEKSHKLKEGGEPQSRSKCMSDMRVDPEKIEEDRCPSPACDEPLLNLKESMYSDNKSPTSGENELHNVQV